MADKQPKPKARSFQIREGVTFGDEPVVAISYANGISVRAGSAYTTSDERVAARLAAEPMLEEVQKP